MFSFICKLKPLQDRCKKYLKSKEISIPIFQRTYIQQSFRNFLCKIIFILLKLTKFNRVNFNSQCLDLAFHNFKFLINFFRCLSTSILHKFTDSHTHSPTYGLTLSSTWDSLTIPLLLTKCLHHVYRHVWTMFKTCLHHAWGHVYTISEEMFK